MDVSLSNNYFNYRLGKVREFWAVVNRALPGRREVVQGWKFSWKRAIFIGYSFMPNLLFFSRVALICNGCFLVTFLMHYLPFLGNGVVPSTIIILGNVLAVVINAIMNILYFALTLAGKPVSRYVPVWLFMCNFLFFIFQVILLVK